MGSGEETFKHIFTDNMKKIFCLFLVVCISAAAFGQEPVSWNYEVNSKSASAYEVVFTADVKPGWHLYSQHTGEPGLFATRINFKPNPLISKDGTTREIGKPEKQYNTNIQAEEVFFSGKVKFVQLVKVKPNVKTNITGIIEYVVCNDDRCLPRAKKNFDLKIM